MLPIENSFVVDRAQKAHRTIGATGGQFASTPAFLPHHHGAGGRKAPAEQQSVSNLCCQVCYLEQTNGLAKMCPSVEGSLKELVQQVAVEERSTIDQHNQTTQLGLNSQVKLGARITEIQEQLKHVFEGQALFRKEMEHLKLDVVSKTISKVDFETQM